MSYSLYMTSKFILPKGWNTLHTFCQDLKSGPVDASCQHAEQSADLSLYTNSFFLAPDYDSIHSDDIKIITIFLFYEKRFKTISKRF